MTPPSTLNTYNPTVALRCTSFFSVGENDYSPLPASATVFDRSNHLMRNATRTRHMPMQNVLPIARSNRTVNRVETPSLAWFAMLALAMMSLALPIVGPLDDHHFAERSHAHGHVYLNGQPIPHDHAGASGRLHFHLDRLRSASRAGGLEGGGSTGSVAVAYFADATASLMLAVINAPYHNAPESLRPAPPRGSGDNPLSSFAPPHREPDGVRLLPPVRPPIA